MAVATILLYRLKPRFGLAPLYIFIGSNQYLQTVLASSFYVKVFGEYLISPGSIILFSAGLLAILLVYLKEGVQEMRRPARKAAMRYCARRSAEPASSASSSLLPGKVRYDSNLLP